MSDKFNDLVKVTCWNAGTFFFFFWDKMQEPVFASVKL